MTMARARSSGSGRVPLLFHGLFPAPHGVSDPWNVNLHREAKGLKTRVPLKFEEYAAGITIGLLGLITFANVVVRYLTNFSFAFTEEFSIFLMVLVALLGGSSVMAKGGHLNIMFVVDRLSPRAPADRRLRGPCPRGPHVSAAGDSMGAGWPGMNTASRSHRPASACPPGSTRLAARYLSLAICGRAVGVLIRVWRRKRLMHPALLLFGAFFRHHVCRRAHRRFPGPGGNRGDRHGRARHHGRSRPMSTQASPSTRFWPSPCSSWQAPSSTVPAWRRGCFGSPRPSSAAAAGRWRSSRSWWP